MQSTGNKTEDLKGTECVKSTPAASAVQIPEVKQDAVSEPVTPASLAALQSDVQPVGHDYVEEVFEKTIALKLGKRKKKVSPCYKHILCIKSSCSQL